MELKVPMRRLTNAHWKGLTMHACREHGCIDIRDIRIEAPQLLLWREADASFDLHRGAGKKWSIQTTSGSTGFFPCADFERIRRNGKTSAVMVSFDSQWLQRTEHSCELLWNPDAAPFQHVDSGLAQMVQALTLHSIDGEPLGSIYTQSLSVAIVLRAAAQLASPLRQRAPEILPRRSARLIQDVIEHNLHSPPDVWALGALAGMGCDRFLRSFRRTFGVALHQYVISKRIDFARIMLAGSDQPIASIAEELGFTHAAHFSRTIRAHTGKTPRELRGAGY